MLLFAVRSLARVWVTAKRDSAVLPYNGELLLACAITASATDVILLLDSFTSDRPKTLQRSRYLTAVLLLVSGLIGIAIAGICRAWLHTARLAIVGGWMHPRSLVAAAFTSVAFGILVVLISIQNSDDI